MKIDKSIGKGYWNVEDSTLLDDLAFSLLCESIKKKNGDYRNQAFFKYHKMYSPYNMYYRKAQIILRHKKIENVNNRIQTKSN